MPGIYTAVDANLNRASEGLRVCEDIFRFNIKNAHSESFKELRHRLKEGAGALPRTALLRARDVAGDAQKFVDLGGESRRDGIPDLFYANIRRAAEAVRVIEEFSKASEHLDSRIFQEIRFRLYDLEKICGALIAGSEALNLFYNSLYAIIDSSFISPGDIPETARRLSGWGVKIIQVRMKNFSDREYLDVCRKTAAVCREEGALFIVNDSPHIALLCGADGLHLGQDDISPGDAREIIGESVIIGLSAGNEDQVCDDRAACADYIAAGPVFSTSSKNGALLNGLGAEFISTAVKLTEKPVVAIGGIDPESVESLLDAGASSIAVISSLFRGGNIEDNVKAYMDILCRRKNISTAGAEC